MTEDETRVGLKPPADVPVLVSDINERVVWFKRTFTDLEGLFHSPPHDLPLSEGCVCVYVSVCLCFVVCTGVCCLQAVPQLVASFS